MDAIEQGFERWRKVRRILTKCLARCLSSMFFAGVLPAHATLHVMPLGDSITEGWAFPASIPGGYRLPLYQLMTGNGYQIDFVGTLTVNSAPALPYPNHEGHGGYRIDQITSGFPGWVASVNSPDLILLQIGTNDYGQNYDPTNAVSRLDQLISQIVALRPNARVVVANLILRTDNTATDTSIQSTFNPYVPGIVAKHSALGHRVWFLDMRSALGPADLADGVHPNQVGYNKMAARWYEEITRVLNGVIPLAQPRLSIKFAADQNSGANTINGSHGAGVLNTTNWFNLTGTSGGSNGMTKVTFYTDRGIVCASDAALVYGYSAEENLINTSGAPLTNNVALLNSYIVPPNNGWYLSVTNLDPVFTNGYDVYFYFQAADNAGSKGGQNYVRYYSGRTTNTAILGVQQWNLYTTSATNSGSFVRDLTPANTSTAGETPGANYFVFTNLTGGAFDLLLTNGTSSGLSALEIVARLPATNLLSMSLNAGPYATPVVFTDQVSPIPPDGQSVTFLDGTNVLGAGLLSNGEAAYTTRTLGLGGHAITAVYAGEGNYLASTSSVVNLTVTTNSAAINMVSSSTNPALLGAPIILTNRIVPAPLDGEVVTFRDGTTELGTGALSGGVATFAISNLALGTHSITAIYPGEVGYLASTSSILAQAVILNLPILRTGQATVTSPTNASLNGLVMANGTNAAVAWLEWGENSSYGQMTAPTNIGSGFALVPVKAAISNLMVGGVYCYRVVASNAFGKVFGGEGKFTTGGRILAWGDNTYGQTNVPPVLTNVVSLGCGYYHQLAVRNDGSVVAWGQNTSGQTNVPPGLTNVMAAAGGGNFSLALRADGTVAAWGDNSFGQTNVPAGLSNVVAVAAGATFSLALKADGTVVAWGNNGAGQANVPAGLNHVVAIAAGAFHGLALRFEGTVAAWGNNSFNQTNVPAGASNLVAVAAGQSHNLALKADGTVLAWGSNVSGQTNVPAGLNNGWRVAGGGNSSHLLKVDGTVQGWGDNSYGQTNVPGGLTNAVLLVDGNRTGFALWKPQPQASALTVNGYVNHDVAVHLSGTDPGGDPLNFRVTSLPAVGTLYQSPGGTRGAVITVPDTAVSDGGEGILFAPGTNAVGEPYATFDYVANNGSSDSATAQVTVNVSLPTAAQVTTTAMNAGSGTISLSFTGSTNATYSVQASTNLVSWDVIGTGTELTPGLYLFLDTATNWPSRFYRLRAP